MRYRKLGASSLEVPLISFGAWAIGGWYWGGSDDLSSIEALQTGLDQGITAIDTAPVYGFGHSETIIGRALVGRREEALVMTKAGLRWDCEDGQFFFSTADNSGRQLKLYRNSRPASLRQEVEDSLTRLGIECIDLLQIHWPDPTTPLAESMGALCELRVEGKLREIGVSNFSIPQMDAARLALGDVPLASCQPKYNLLQRAIEADVLPYALGLNIGTLVYSPMEQGLLSGKVTAERKFPADDGRNKHPNFKPERRARVNHLLETVVQPIAAGHDADVAQTVLAWTVAQPGVTSALAGARSAVQAKQNAAAGDLLLADDELTTIDRAFRELLAEAPLKEQRSGLRALLKRALRLKRVLRRS